MAPRVLCTHHSVSVHRPPEDPPPLFLLARSIGPGEQHATIRLTAADQALARLRR